MTLLLYILSYLSLGVIVVVYEFVTTHEDDGECPDSSASHDIVVTKLFILWLWPLVSLPKVWRRVRR